MILSLGCNPRLSREEACRLAGDGEQRSPGPELPIEGAIAFESEGGPQQPRQGPGGQTQVALIDLGGRLAGAAPLAALAAEHRHEPRAQQKTRSITSPVRSNAARSVSGR